MENMSEEEQRIQREKLAKQAEMEKAFQELMKQVNEEMPDDIVLPPLPSERKLNLLDSPNSRPKLKAKRRGKQQIDPFLSLQLELNPRATAELLIDWCRSREQQQQQQQQVQQGAKPKVQHQKPPNRKDKRKAGAAKKPETVDDKLTEFLDFQRRETMKRLYQEEAKNRAKLEKEREIREKLKNEAAEKVDRIVNMLEKLEKQETAEQVRGSQKPSGNAEKKKTAEKKGKEKKTDEKKTDDPAELFEFKTPRGNVPKNIAAQKKVEEKKTEEKKTDVPVEVYELQKSRGAIPKNKNVGKKGKPMKIENKETNVPVEIFETRKLVGKVQKAKIAQMKEKQKKAEEKSELCEGLKKLSAGKKVEQKKTADAAEELYETEPPLNKEDIVELEMLLEYFEKNYQLNKVDEDSEVCEQDCKHDNTCHVEEKKKDSNNNGTEEKGVQVKPMHFYSSKHASAQMHSNCWRETFEYNPNAKDSGIDAVLSTISRVTGINDVEELEKPVNDFLKRQYEGMYKDDGTANEQCVQKPKEALSYSDLALMHELFEPEPLSALPGRIGPLSSDQDALKQCNDKSSNNSSGFLKKLRNFGSRTLSHLGLGWGPFKAIKENGEESDDDKDDLSLTSSDYESETDDDDKNADYGAMASRLPLLRALIPNRILNRAVRFWPNHDSL